MTQKTIKLTLIYLTLAFITIFFCRPTFAQSVEENMAEASGDKTLSPYFLVQNENGDIDQLPLKSTTAEVNIAGVIADVKITQSYKNQGKVPLEALYIFPGSTRAAVYAMQMRIGERILTAKIKERQQAKQEYKEAKKAGKSASLLEQHRPNVFQMNVANIMPGDEIKVELNYTELLVPEKNIYEFVFPTVVGPRYSNQSAATTPPQEHWVENPYLHEGNSPTYSFSIKVNIAAGLPIKELISDSHHVKIDFHNESDAEVTLDGSEEFSGNKDFVLRYRLAGEEIDSGILLYQAHHENFFLLTMQPPKSVRPEILPGREYIFVIDVSGSMDGFPLATAKSLIKNLIGNLKASDLFNVLLFSGDSALMSKTSLPASNENIVSAISLIEGQRGMGGTELIPALKRTLNLPRNDQYSRSIIIITDGYISVERDALDLITKNLGNANIFSFGIGSSVNRYLIEGLAHAGGGLPFIVTRPSQAEETAQKFRKYIEAPVLTNIDVSYNDFSVSDVSPIAVADLFAERPLVILGKWQGALSGSIHIHGTTGLGEFSKDIDLSRYKAESKNSALKYLWARSKISELSDYNKIDKNSELEKQITKLGLDYNLLTEFTSFIAVDHVVRNTSVDPKTVKQALPLPEGVSDLAVGGMIPSAPEPEMYLLFTIAGLALFIITRSRTMKEPNL